MSVSYCPNTTGWSDNLISGVTPLIDASCDSDLDGIINTADSFPFDSNEYIDTDSDGIGNNADTDDDNDGILDEDDENPLAYDAPVETPLQIVSVGDNPRGVNGETLSFDINYEVSDENDSLTGLGLRIHYDSTVITFSEFEFIFPQDLIATTSPVNDSQDLDNEPLTDKYITASWASLYLDWPGDLPAHLLTVMFDVISNNDISTTRINFSNLSSTAGYNFSNQFHDLPIIPATWDFDDNHEVDALTDGLMMLRYAFGLRGNALTDYAISPESVLSSQDVGARVEKSEMIFDIDGNGSVDALTDGLIFLRYAFGIRNSGLINDVIDPNASRTSSEDIETYIDSYMP